MEIKEHLDNQGREKKARKELWVKEVRKLLYFILQKKTSKRMLWHI
jgi:hypothetical protein